jgi:hypothetical protein
MIPVTFQWRISWSMGDVMYGHEWKQASRDVNYVAHDECRQSRGSKLVMKTNRWARCITRLSPVYRNINPRILKS